MLADGIVVIRLSKYSTFSVQTKIMVPDYCSLFTAESCLCLGWTIYVIFVNLRLLICDFQNSSVCTMMDGTAHGQHQYLQA